jgi:hypothetical protein
MIRAGRLSEEAERRNKIFAALIEKVRFATDSPVEGAGVEFSVSRDTTKVSRPPDIASA